MWVVVAHVDDPLVKTNTVADEIGEVEEEQPTQSGQQIEGE